MLLSLEVAVEQNRLLAVTQVSHSDCRDVKNIYESAASGTKLKHRYQITLFRPYLWIANLVIEQQLTRQQSLDLLSAAKAIQDMNHILSYGEIQKSIEATTSAHFLEHYDISTKPRRLMVFNPNEQIYEHLEIGNGERRRSINVGPRTLDIVSDPNLLLTYQIKEPIDLEMFIIAEAKRIRLGTSIILSQVQESSAQIALAEPIASDTLPDSRPSIRLPYQREAIITPRRDKHGRFKKRKKQRKRLSL